MINVLVVVVAALLSLGATGAGVDPEAAIGGTGALAFAIVSYRQGERVIAKLDDLVSCQPKKKRARKRKV